MNLSGVLEPAASAYAQRSIIPDGTVSSLSNTSAVAAVSSFPVTGPIPEGSAFHDLLSGEN